MSSGDSRNQGSNIVRERGVPHSEQMHTLRNIIKHQLWGSEPSARFSALPYSSQATRSDQCPSQSCPSLLAFSVKHEYYQWFEVQYGIYLTSETVFCARENIIKILPRKCNILTPYSTSKYWIFCLIYFLWFSIMFLSNMRHCMQ